MVVAVRAMGMMHMSTDDVIEVIAVRNAFMPAFRAVSVVAAMRSTLVVRRAGVGVRASDRNRVLVNMAVMEVMHVTIMKIVRVPLVGYSHVPAIRTMLVTVFGVLCATFFHASPFDGDSSYDDVRTEKKTLSVFLPGFSC